MSSGRRLGSALVQGASRGIGLEYCRQLLFRHQVPFVFAACRNPSSSTANQLHELQQSVTGSQRLHILKLDLEDESTIIESSKETADLLSSADISHLECLINSSGILHRDDIGMEPERSLNMINEQWLKILFQTHSIGPLMVIKHFHSLMAHPDKKLGALTPSLLVNMSARVGSIGDNKLGGWYGYRASKTALNQITKTSSHELKRKNIITFCLHPGTVATDLSKPFQSGVKPGKLFDVEYSVECLLDIIVNADVSMNGGYFDWKKESIEW